MEKNLCFKIDEKLINELKIIAINKNVTLKQLLTGLIKEEIEKNKN